MNVSEKIQNWVLDNKNFTKEKEYFNFVVKYDKNKGGITKGEIAVLNKDYIEEKKKNFIEFTYANREIKLKPYQNLKNSNNSFFIDFLSEIWDIT